jgi:predicted transcriptional regulator
MILLLSIRPKYADKIFAGDKKVELRRTRPRLQKGDVVIVYASSPKKAIIGSFEVDKIINKPLDNLWNEVAEKAAVSHHEFLSYYEGLSEGCGIFVGKCQLFAQAVDLKYLREEWSNFRPPQSYRYLTKKETDLVESMTNFNIQKFVSAQ